jgi:hypothetical protein
MIDGLGWIATAVFSASYFFQRPRAMLAVQVCAAILWIGYGLLAGTAPVVVANGIVAAAALWRWTRRDGRPEGPIGA